MARKSTRKQTEDYTISDMEALYRRGEWHDWQDAVNWLKREGNNDNELTPGEVRALEQDLETLEKEGAEFVPDPDKAFQMAHAKRR